MIERELLIGPIPPLSADAAGVARAHLDRLTKPPGSLGRVEELVVRLAEITGDPFAPVLPRAVVVAAADHGVAAAHSVSAWPQSVTAAMVANFLAGGAAISSLARLAQARLIVVDAGIATPVALPSTRDGTDGRRLGIRTGTADFLAGPAMTRDEAMDAVQAGIDLAADLAGDGVRVIGLGEMGIGNTTSASAIVAAVTGRAAAEVTGPGAGLDEAGQQVKRRVVEMALTRHRPDPADPVGLLAAVGGLEIGTLAGLIVGGAAARIPVVLDGFITAAAALVAVAIAPAARPRLIAAHRSTEPGHAIALEQLGLRPLLELDLRLGEGTGAALAMLLLDAAVSIRDGMATFDAAGIATGTPRPTPVSASG